MKRQSEVGTIPYQNTVEPPLGISLKLYRYRYTKMKCTAVLLLTPLPDTLAVTQYSRQTESNLRVSLFSRLSARHTTVVATETKKGLSHCSGQRDNVVTSSPCSDVYQFCCE